MTKDQPDLDRKRVATTLLEAARLLARRVASEQGSSFDLHEISLREMSGSRVSTGLVSVRQRPTGKDVVFLAAQVRMTITCKAPILTVAESLIARSSEIGLELYGDNAIDPEFRQATVSLWFEFNDTEFLQVDLQTLEAQGLAAALDVELLAPGSYAPSPTDERFLKPRPAFYGVDRQPVLNVRLERWLMGILDRVAEDLSASQATANLIVEVVGADNVGN